MGILSQDGICTLWLYTLADVYDYMKEFIKAIKITNNTCNL